MRFQPKHPQALFDELGQSLFQQLATASGAGSSAFRERFLPVAERLALTVQELPLERATFAQQGGALKFGLVSALTTLRLCDSVVFAPDASAEVRMRVEPQYRLAAFCASLATVPLIIDHSASVTIDGRPWSMLDKQMLWEALEGGRGYEVAWKPVTVAKPIGSLGILILSRFFEPGQWSSFEPEVVRGLCEAINPGAARPPAETALAKVVRVGHEKVRQAEQLRASALFTPDTAAPIQALMDATTTALDQATSFGTLAAHPPAQSAQAAEPQIQIPLDIVQWATAVAHSSDMMQRHVQLLPDGRARIGPKALNFGVEAKKMYERIFTAGLVSQREEKSILVTAPLAAIFGAH